MIGGELHGHRPSDIVAYHGGPREAEVGAEGVKEAAAVADAVARGGLVGLAEPLEVEGIDSEALRETAREPLPYSGGREPAMHEHDRRPPAYHAVAYPAPLKLQILGVASTPHLVSHPPQHHRGQDKHGDEQQDRDENAAHR